MEEPRITLTDIGELFGRLEAMQEASAQIAQDQSRIHRAHTDSGAIAFIADIKRERIWDFTQYPPEHAISPCNCERDVPGHTCIFMEQTGLSPSGLWVLQIASQVTHDGTTRVSVNRVRENTGNALAASEHAVFFPQDAEDFRSIAKFLRRLINRQDG